MDEIAALIQNQAELLREITNKLNTVETNMALLQHHYQVLSMAFVHIQEKLSHCPPTCPYRLDAASEFQNG